MNSYTTYTRKNPTITSIVVEYDCNGQRATKEFTDVFKARSFYKSKTMAGKNPAIKSAARQ